MIAVGLKASFALAGMAISLAEMQLCHGRLNMHQQMVQTRLAPLLPAGNRMLVNNESHITYHQHL
jgi:hypothetical protein